MSAESVFNPLARQIIYEAAGQRCVGCGRADPLTCQHRRARGMGGSRLLSIGHPANGVALCGSGTTGCHGWVERNPDLAALLGWRLLPGEDALIAPYWQRVWGWRRWHQCDDGFVDVLYVDTDEIPDLVDREAAIETYRRDLDERIARYGGVRPDAGLKSQR